MQKNKCYKILGFLLLFVLYSMFSLYVYNQTKVYIHRAMIWNLILAVLPLYFSFLFLEMMKRKRKVIAIICAICWLLLFPNVPYLITDFIHITPLTYYEFTTQGSFYIRNIWAWIELLHIGCGVLIGFFAGYRSLLHMQIYVKQRYSLWLSWAMVSTVAILSGFGVFLGRFLRLNSWDVLQPVELVKELHKNVELSFSIPFTCIMAVFVLITYGLFYLCLNHEEEQSIK